MKLVNILFSLSLILVIILTGCSGSQANGSAYHSDPQQIISVKTGQEFSIRVDIFEITDDLYVENLLNAVWLVDYDRGLLELIDEEHFYLLVDGHNVEERAIYTFKALVAGNGEVIATYKSLWEVPGFIDFVFDQVFSVHIIS